MSGVWLCMASGSSILPWIVSLVAGTCVSLFVFRSFHCLWIRLPFGRHWSSDVTCCIACPSDDVVLCHSLDVSHWLAPLEVYLGVYCSMDVWISLSYCLRMKCCQLAHCLECFLMSYCSVSVCLQVIFSSSPYLWWLGVFGSHIKSLAVLVLL